MKRSLILFLFSVSVLCLHAQVFYVGTYNIRYDGEGDRKEGNGWERRCQVICDMLNFEQPDIFGVQEALVNQVNDLKNGLDGYDFIGVGRDDGKQAGEFSPIFYKKDKVKKVRHGHFWLNETPAQPKLGWDAACVRICTWGEFKDLQSRKKFYFFNLHMDHVGIIARREAARLVMRKIKEIAGEGALVILTGDFNVDQNNEIYRTFIQSGMLQDSYAVSKHRLAENGTFQGFRSDKKTDSRIDHIFVSPQFVVEKYGILTHGYWTDNDMEDTTKEGNAPQEIYFRNATHRLPSDHFPVMAKVKVKR